MLDLVLECDWFALQRTHALVCPILLFLLTFCEGDLLDLPVVPVCQGHRVAWIWLSEIDYIDLCWIRKELEARVRLQSQQICATILFKRVNMAFILAVLLGLRLRRINIHQRFYTVN